MKPVLKHQEHVFFCRHLGSVTPIKGTGTGRSIVDMCLACARARDCFGSMWHVFLDVLEVCEFLIFPFHHDFSQAIKNLPLVFPAHGS